MRVEILACSVLMAMTCACSEGAAPATSADECRPFEIETAAIELAMVLGAGRDQGGTLYVVDESEGELRAFVGSEASLTRVPIVGSSQSNTEDLQRDSLVISARPRSYLLIVERSARMVTMARSLDVDARDPAIDGLPASAVLEPIEPSTIEDAELYNLPAEVVVEYLAQRPEGEVLLIIRPEQPDGLDYDSFRVFYGPEEQLAEREIILVERARDGGSTHVVFTLDGATADAFFPVEFDGGQFQPGPATLDHGGTVVALELLDAAEHAERLEGTRFECLE